MDNSYVETRDKLHIGDFEVEPTLNRLRRGGETLTVEPRVMDLLVLLAESPGQVFLRDEILERVWPETTVQDDALRRVVTVLRRVLEDDPKQPRYIETITRRGYRLVAPVTAPASNPTLKPTGAPEAGSLLQPQSSEAGASTPPPAPERGAEPGSTKSLSRLWLAAVILALTVVVAVAWLSQRAGVADGQFDLRPFTSLPGHESDPAFSSDGQRVAFIHRQDGETSLMVKRVGAASGDSEARRILMRPRLAYPAWSPSGDRVLVTVLGEGCEVLAAPVGDTGEAGRDAGGEVTAESLYTCEAGERLDKVLQPDEQTLLITRRPARFGSPWRLHSYNLATQESTQLTLPSEPGSGDTFIALSPDRRRVAVIRHLLGDRSKLLILDLVSGTREEIAPFPDTSWEVSWSQDAQSLIFADGTGLYRFGIEDSRVERLLASPQDLRQPSVSPVDDRVVAVDLRMRSDVMKQRNPLSEADLDPTAEPEVIASSTRAEFMPRFGVSPGENDRLAFISARSGRSEIWATRPGGGLDLIFGVDPPNHIHAFLWSPDGSQIAVADHHSQLLIVDVDSGATEIAPGSAAGPLLDWSADGSAIYHLETTEGSPEVWKVGLDDGARRQITRCGAKMAQEGPNGEFLYVTRLHVPGLWRVDLEGDGQAIPVLDDVNWLAWKSTDRGIYSFEYRLDPTGIYFRGSSAQGSGLEEPILVQELPFIKLDFAVSKDHRWLAFTRASARDGDLILIDG